jgi:methionyl-tRNA synthetase
VEDNWFFRLSAFQRRLEEWYRDHPDWVRPEGKRNEMTGLLEEGLQDLSVSRPVKATRWGIPFPGDEDHVIYVWFEALVNYVTAARLAEDGSLRPDEPGRGPGFWPADVHVIGKDILRFHAIIWPAMLWAADLPLPGAVSSHGFVQVGGERMSKSGGGSVSPVEIADEYGSETLRWFLMREVPWGGDGEFSIERLEERYQSDLANTLGNLLHRTLTMIEKYCGGAVPERSEDRGPAAAHRARARDLLLDAVGLYDEQQFSLALERVLAVARDANVLVDDVQPWKRIRDADGRDAVEALLHALVHSLRDVAAFLLPVMPERARAIWTSLGLDAASLDDLVLSAAAEGHKDAENLEEMRPDRVFSALDAIPLEGLAVRKGEPLFPRRDHREP